MVEYALALVVGGGLFAQVLKHLNRRLHLLLLKRLILRQFNQLQILLLRRVLICVHGTRIRALPIFLLLDIFFAGWSLAGWHQGFLRINEVQVLGVVLVVDADDHGVEFGFEAHMSPLFLDQEVDGAFAFARECLAHVVLAGVVQAFHFGFLLLYPLFPPFTKQLLHFDDDRDH